MDINEIKINTNTLSGDIDKLESWCSDLLSDVQKLEELLDELNTMWKGTANAAFNAQYESDCRFLQTVIKEFRQYNSKMRDAGTEYDKCETTVQDIVRSIQI